MRTESRSAALAAAAGAKANPRIEITPSPSQYQQLCRDLAKLRSQGAASNTAAILAAVHIAAAAPILGEVRAKNGAKRPRARAGG